jgi:hypothetical protein
VIRRKSALSSWKNNAVAAGDEILPKRFDKHSKPSQNHVQKRPLDAFPQQRKRLFLLWLRGNKSQTEFID